MLPNCLSASMGDGLLAAAAGFLLFGSEVRMRPLLKLRVQNELQKRI